MSKILDGQYRRPTGLLGLVIGRRMAHQHRPENLWTVSILQPQPTDYILEIGFGPGVAIQELSKKVTEGRIAGVDFSKAMVCVARLRNAATVRNGLMDLRYGDATTLPFADHGFDKAFSIHSVYFWPQPRLVLKEIHRMLKPGGMLVLTILPKEKWNMDNPNEPVGTPECQPYTGHELAQLLIEAGFSRTRIESDINAANRSNYSVIGIA